MPRLNLGFEFQGEQHYSDVSVFGSSQISSMEKDEEKMRICKEQGESLALIQVPFWWDYRIESIAATISFSLERFHPQISKKIADQLGGKKTSEANGNLKAINTMMAAN